MEYKTIKKFFLLWFFRWAIFDIFDRSFRYPIHMHSRDKLLWSKTLILEITKNSYNFGDFVIQFFLIYNKSKTASYDFGDYAEIPLNFIQFCPNHRNIREWLLLLFLEVFSVENVLKNRQNKVDFLLFFALFYFWYILFFNRLYCTLHFIFDIQIAAFMAQKIDFGHDLGVVHPSRAS